MLQEIPDDRKDTFFAPAKRTPSADLRPFARRVLQDPIVKAILASIPGSVLILNKERQILAGNREVIDTLGLTDGDTVIGLRPGEAFVCVHASEGPSGCGTSRHCKACGAVIAILSALENHETFKGECTLSLNHNDRLQCLNLAVQAVPIEILGQQCIEFVFHDISELKMKEVMDRIFLHDLKNAITGVMGWSELIYEKDHDNKGARKLVAISGEIMRMIEDHSCLLHAESGDLNTTSETVCVEEILSTLENSVSSSSFARDATLSIRKTPLHKAVFIKTDRRLLNRIIVNMVKNAFEATAAGGEISVDFCLTPEARPVFTVTNPGCIPEDTQLRIFQRGFSTKGGGGRGFGTYGMKLLGENYLEGEVGFRSTPGEGTSFFIKLPGNN
jgi:signal transduction histidine kinase